VHGSLALWPGTCSSRAHHHGECVVAELCSPHSDWETERGGARVPTLPSRARFQGSNFLPPGHTSSKSTTSPIASQAEGHALNTWSLGTLQTSTVHPYICLSCPTCVEDGHPAGWHAQATRVTPGALAPSLFSPGSLLIIVLLPILTYHILQVGSKVRWHSWRVSLTLSASIY
jgi:hypothetical protein